MICSGLIPFQWGTGTTPGPLLSTFVSRNSRVGKGCSSCYMLLWVDAANKYLCLLMSLLMNLDTVLSFHFTTALSIGKGWVTELVAATVDVLALLILGIKPRRLYVGSKHLKHSYKLYPFCLHFTALSPLPPSCWDYRFVPPYSALFPSCWKSPWKPPQNTPEHCFLKVNRTHSGLKEKSSIGTLLHTLYLAEKL